MHRWIALGCVVLLAACSDDKVKNVPMLYDRTVTTAEDTAIAVEVSVTADDASAVALSVVTPPGHGTLTGDGPTWTYTPATDYTGSDVFVVRGEDRRGSAMATITMNVTPVNDAPIANPDSFADEFNTELNVPQMAVLANDTDVDGQALTVTQVVAGTHGVPVLGDGNILFTPEPGFEGVATFEYTISDGALSAHATVSITIGVDQAPVAVDDAATTLEDTTLALGDAALLANDSDADHQVLRVAAVGNASHGSVTHAGTEVTFVPDVDFHGVAGFDYTVTDGFKTAVGSVVVTVTSVNDAPIIVTSSGAAGYVENAAPVAVDPDVVIADVDDASLVGATVQLTTGCTSPQDVLALASPPPGITVTDYVPATCTLTLLGTASVASYQTALRGVTYVNTSEAPASAGRVAQFTVDDGELANHTASDDRDLAVTPVDDAPVAVNDSATVVEDSGPNAILVLANDTDVDAGPKSISAVTQATNGAVVITGGGTGLTYAPRANFCNRSPGLALAPQAPVRDMFTYTLSPGDSVATVSIMVTCVDDPPIAVADSESVAEDSAGNVFDVLGERHRHRRWAQDDRVGHPARPRQRVGRAARALGPLHTGPWLLQRGAERTTRRLHVHARARRQHGDRLGDRSLRLRPEQVDRLCRGEQLMKALRNPSGRAITRGLRHGLVACVFAGCAAETAAPPEPAIGSADTDTDAGRAISALGARPGDPARTAALVARANDLVRPGSVMQTEPRLGVPTFLWTAQQARVDLARGLAHRRRRAPRGRRRRARCSPTTPPLYGLADADVAGAVRRHGPRPRHRPDPRQAPRADRRRRDLPRRAQRGDEPQARAGRAQRLPDQRGDAAGRAGWAGVRARRPPAGAITAVAHLAKTSDRRRRSWSPPARATATTLHAAAGRRASRSTIRSVSSRSTSTCRTDSRPRTTSRSSARTGAAPNRRAVRRR